MQKKKKLNNIYRNKIMTFMFVVILGLVSANNFFKVMNYYINGEMDYNEWNSSTDTKFETDYISNFWLKYQYINLNGALRNLLGQREMNGVIKLKNGYLNQRNEQIDDSKIAYYAEENFSFQQKLAEKGIDYIWFTLPYVVDKYNNQMPIGIEDDYGNYNLDRLSEAFLDRGINIVDLRENIHNEGKETYDIFYKTDHHWTTLGGFWAYNQIVDYIEENYDLEVDDTIRDINNYDIITYKEWHLGSRGQRTGKYFAGIDDFELIIPQFDTYVQRFGTDTGGSIQEMMINMASLQKSDYMSRYTYDSVLGGAWGYWHNPSASANIKIMVIGDSMSKAVFPYLALSFSDVAYGAYSADVSGVTSNLIDSYQPDIIISLDYITSIGDSAFSYGLIYE